MKKIFLYTSLSLALVACNDKFITKDPLGVSTDVTFYNDEENCRLATNAIYDPFARQSLYDRNYLVFDGMSDDAEKGGDPKAYLADQTDLHQIILYNANPLNAATRGFWKYYYDIISRANALLDAAPTDNANINKMRAEAQFLRALAYLDLVKIYGPVPLVTSVVSPDDAKSVGNRADGDDAVGTKQIQEIYKFIAADLESIKGILPASYSGAEFGKVSNTAVQALLAKVYLFAGDYKKSYEVSKELIGANPSANLEPVYHNIFNFECTHENIPEVIFSIQMIPSPGYNEQGDGSIKTIDMGPRVFEKNGAIHENSGIGYGLNIPTQNLVNAFDPQDPRLDMIAKMGTDSLYLDAFTANSPEWTKIGKHDNSTGYYSLKPYISYNVKKTNGASSQSQEKDIIIIRWAEVLLNGAEAAIREGNTADALAWTNAVRKRARESKRLTNDIDMNQATYGTGTVPADLTSITLTDVKNEKRLELFMENGTRYFDLVRWNTTNDSDQINANAIFAEQKTDLVGKARTWDESKLGRLPIPMSELILHSGGNLIQNPGY